ncbi:mechanosensitive ion channel family protein [Actinoallomurus sp. CA-150999]|uniref:mechanosensitive ion channel family protein n=1 Tax=Actinoallomurus sp. CA-150999 TaxID=3239887 RepID=UPI003D8EF632
MGTVAQIDVGRSLQNVLDAVARIVPRLIVFVIILVIGWIIAKVIQRLVALILRRLHFDRVAERGVVGDALRRGEYDASGLLAKLVYYAILLVALELAFNVFGSNPVSNVLRSIVAWLPRLAVAVIIVIVASAIAHAVRDLVGGALGGLSYGRLLANLAAIFIIALGVIAALNQMGIATTVTEPVLIAVLATIGAVIAIGVGGGLVRPMQQRWERWLTHAEAETATARTGAYARGREDAERGVGTPSEASPGRTGTAETPRGAPEAPPGRSEPRGTSGAPRGPSETGTMPPRGPSPETPPGPQDRPR